MTDMVLSESCMAGQKLKLFYKNFRFKFLVWKKSNENRKFLCYNFFNDSKDSNLIICGVRHAKETPKSSNIYKNWVLQKELDRRAMQNTELMKFTRFSLETRQKEKVRFMQLPQHPFVTS